jgi:phosphatidate phosphatase APP1
MHVSVAAMSQDKIVSDLKSDERIVFFATDARLSADQRQWIVPIHAWVHELENKPIRRATIAAALSMKYGLTTSPATKANFDRRIKLIVADNERGKQIVIDLAGQRFTLPRTAPNGHVVGEFVLDADAVTQHARDGKLTFAAILQSGDQRAFTGSIHLISPTGISVISDFDDTVKVTQVSDRAKMLANSLYRDYQAIPGMSDRYASWAQQGVAFHFVSSSPWHLYEPIKEFLDSSKFPSSSMSLKHVRFRDATLLNLFKKGIKTKPAQIVPIITAYPQRHFILIGDSGEHDPEVYADMHRKFPEQVKRIYIHNVSGSKRTDERFSKVFEGIDPAKWALFDDPQVLELTP